MPVSTSPARSRVSAVVRIPSFFTFLLSLWSGGAAQQLEPLKRLGSATASHISTARCWRNHQRVATASRGRYNRHLNAACQSCACHSAENLTVQCTVATCIVPCESLAAVSVAEALQSLQGLQGHRRPSLSGQKLHPKTAPEQFATQFNHNMPSIHSTTHQSPPSNPQSLNSYGNIFTVERMQALKQKPAVRPHDSARRGRCRQTHRMLTNMLTN